MHSNIVIQLNGKTSNNENRMKTHVMNKKIVDSLLEKIEEFNKDLDPEEPIFQHESIVNLRKLTSFDEGDEGFSFKDTFSVIGK